jgi:hypothetical protein
VLAVSGFALALGLGLLSPLADLSVTSSGAAWAAEDGEGSEGGQGKGQKGQAEGKGNQGSQKGQGNQGGSDKGQGGGQGGPGEDSDGKGPQAGGPSADGSGGGKPVWAQEGIPEVELGRLSVARSPDKVLDRAYAEAVSSLTPEAVDFYNQTLDQMIEDFSINWDTITIIDSPLQNLAFLRDSLDGTVELPGVTTDVETLQAVFLGVASDKTVPITTDTVIAVTTILGTPIIGDEAAALAAEAEAVRIAVLAGHG